MRLALEKRARQCGVPGRLHFADHWLSESEYRDHLVAANVGVQLRSHFLGGLSGALLDCVASGLPTVANEGLAASVETPSYVVRIPDRPDPVALADGIDLLLRRKPDSQEIITHWRHFVSEHSFEAYVRQLVGNLFLESARRLIA